MKRSLACLVMVLLIGLGLGGCSTSASTPLTQGGPVPAASSTSATPSPSPAPGSGAASDSATLATGAAPEPTDQGAGVATLAKLDKIKVGMKYDTVAKIMGGPGKKLGEATVAGVHAVTYGWYGSDITTGIVVQFANDKVSGKSQTGLQ